MLACRICGCLCDPADTINEVCDDCREDMRYREETREEAENEGIDEDLSE